MVQSRDEAWYMTIKGVAEISTIFETALARVRASASRECSKDQCYHYID